MSLYRGDYLDPEIPSLRQAVYNRVKSATGWAPEGPIELITHPRYLGYVFNPVSFYLATTVERAPERRCAQSHPGTDHQYPWKQRHVYCLESHQPGPGIADTWHTERFDFSKRFHVSPFNGMKQEYSWLFSFKGPQLRIHMNVEQDREKHFDATLVVQRSPFDRKTLHRGLRRFPLETIKGTAGIYWNALKLKLKGAPFHTHPDKLDSNNSEYRKGVDDRGTNVTLDPALSHSESVHAGRVSSWRT